jgi:hypothetical protein
LFISIGGLGENGSLHKIEKIKTDTMFISNTKYGVRVKTYEVEKNNTQFFVCISEQPW